MSAPRPQEATVGEQLAAGPVYRFVVPGCPVPKARPRIGSGRAYTPKRTQAHERLVWACAAKARAVRPLDGDVSLVLRFYLPDNRRRDLDNLAKTVQDALNGTTWHDDSQVARLHISRHLDRENPRTEVEIGLA